MKNAVLMRNFGLVESLEIDLNKKVDSCVGGHGQVEKFIKVLGRERYV